MLYHPRDLRREWYPNCCEDLLLRVALHLKDWVLRRTEARLLGRARAI